MYERHYGLSEKPFEIAPDPKFLFLNSNYRELLASLIYGVTERKGLIALVGEVGTGKTLMLNALKERLDASVKVATIVNPDLTFRQMLNMILADLDLYRGSKTISVENGLQRLQHFAKEQFESSGNVVVIVDEAQNLRSKTMESMRMLSNIETASAKLIQLIFSGQPELDQKLKKPEWRQLVQRISIKRRSTQLTYAECREYIRHRLAVAGSNGSSPFSDNAQKAIFAMVRRHTTEDQHSLRQCVADRIRVTAGCDRPGDRGGSGFGSGLGEPAAYGRRRGRFH